jgi:hypothetical protein
VPSTLRSATETERRFGLVYAVVAWTNGDYCCSYLKPADGWVRILQSLLTSGEHGGSIKQPGAQL